LRRLAIEELRQEPVDGVSRWRGDERGVAVDDGCEPREEEKHGVGTGDAHGQIDAGDRH
jgi:hypothetical protein